MNGPDAIETTGQAAPEGMPPTARLLLRVVIIMGVVLLLLFVALVGGIIWKSARKAEPMADAPPPQISLGLPQDAEIRSTALDGDRLVINTGREVVIVDIRKNAIVSRVSVSP